MNPRNSLWQFIKDGLVSIVIILITFAILVAALFILDPVDLQSRADWLNLVSGMFFFQDSIISPMPFVILIGFISVGVGGRFLENITSRWSWIKPILLIVIIAWIIDVVLFQILFIENGFLDWNSLGIILGITALGAGAGFLIAGLTGVIFNPSKRIFRLIIGSIASTLTAYAVGFTILLFQVAD